MAINKILYWDGIIQNPTLLLSEKCKVALDKLLAGNTKSADLELLKHSGKQPLYSIRVNNQERILGTTVPYVDTNGKCANFLLILDHIVKHNYAGSKFMHSGYLKRFLNTLELSKEDFMPCDKITELIPTTASSNTYEFIPVHYYNDKFINFNQIQKTGIDSIFSSLTPAPTIISGAAGTGKTCIAQAVLLQKSQSKTKKILYLAKSKPLVVAIRDNVMQFCDQIQNINFSTYQELVFSEKNLKLTPVPTEYLQNWLLNNKSLKEITALSSIAHNHQTLSTLLYQELRIFSNCNQQQYQALGLRKKLFPNTIDNINIPKAVSDVYHKYQQHLAATGQVDLAFFHASFKKKYDFIVIDESQDFSHLQLQILYSLVIDKNNIVFCLDSQQSMYDSISTREYLVEMLYNSQTQKNRQINSVRLQQAYRTPIKIANLANKLLALQRNIIRGIIDKNSYTKISTADLVNKRSCGKIFFEPLAKARQYYLNIKNRLSTKYAIIISNETLRAEAVALFNTPLVFHINEIKGLEYPNIIGYRLLAGENHKLLQYINNYCANNNFNNKPITNRTKDKYNKLSHAYAAIINKLYIVVTRATESINFIEEPNLFPALIKYLHNENHLNNKKEIDEYKKELRTTNSNIEDWQQEAKKLQNNDNTTRQAAAIRDIINKEAAKQKPKKVRHSSNFKKKHKPLANHNKKAAANATISKTSATGNLLPKGISPKDLIPKKIESFSPQEMAKPNVLHKITKSSKYQLSYKKKFVPAACSAEKQRSQLRTMLFLCSHVEENFSDKTLKILFSDKTEKTHPGTLKFFLHVTYNNFLFNTLHAFDAMFLITKELNKFDIFKKFIESDTKYQEKLIDNLTTEVFDFIYPATGESILIAWLKSQQGAELFYLLLKSKHGPEFAKLLQTKHLTHVQTTLNLSLLNILAFAAPQWTLGHKTLYWLFAYNPKLLNNITASNLTLRRPYSYSGVHLKNSSAFDQLVQHTTGYELLNKILEANSEILKNISLTDLTTVVKNNKQHYTAIRLMIKNELGLTLMERIVDNNDQLVKNLTMHDLTKLETPNEFGVLYWLALCIRAKQIFLKILEKNTALLKEFTIEHLTTVHKDSDGKIIAFPLFYSLSGSHIGDEILVKILFNNPKLIKKITIDDLTIHYDCKVGSALYWLASRAVGRTVLERILSGNLQLAKTIDANFFINPMLPNHVPILQRLHQDQSGVNVVTLLYKQNKAFSKRIIYLFKKSLLDANGKLFAAIIKYTVFLPIIDDKLRDNTITAADISATVDNIPDSDKTTIALFFDHLESNHATLCLAAIDLLLTNNNYYNTEPSISYILLAYYLDLKNLKNITPKTARYIIKHASYPCLCDIIAPNTLYIETMMHYIINNKISIAEITQVLTRNAVHRTYKNDFFKYFLSTLQQASHIKYAAIIKNLMVFIYNANKFKSTEKKFVAQLYQTIDNEHKAFYKLTDFNILLTNILENPAGLLFSCLLENEQNTAIFLQFVEQFHDQQKINTLVLNNIFNSMSYYKDDFAPGIKSFLYQLAIHSPSRHHSIISALKVNSTAKKYLKTPAGFS